MAARSSLSNWFSYITLYDKDASKRLEATNAEIISGISSSSIRVYY
jgi:hypothetical protein